ncbi:transcriptional regulator [Sulfitobacter sp. S0837]|uniref:dimethylsulfonioproprionate lyase family protein n=1 Tax=Sulfitobacter maritimus TaxID=2741719 RepID=UPI0015839A05|nr:dimethylsulfonioproprionate lyase family protein [Sulfitobacter maritimus]NUH64470.1 transcriptional regulator [Sulfitobacter maritimus]
MTSRDPSLEAFLDAAREAYFHRTNDPRALASLHQAFDALEGVKPQSVRPSQRLPVCQLLRRMGSETLHAPDLTRLMDSFFALEPSLNWARRAGDLTGASENFTDNHANAVIFGKNGLEPRDDVTLGISLVGPDTLYPDHRHKPEETYLVISPGDFRQGHRPWVKVASGDTFYNPSNILHSMRSSTVPILAFWVLWHGA